MAKPKQGFATFAPDRLRDVCSRAGQASHRSGRAHEFTADQARDAGRKGGAVVARDRGHMAEIGRRGGLRSRAKRAAMTDLPVSSRMAGVVGVGDGRADPARVGENLPQETVADGSPARAETRTEICSHCVNYHPDAGECRLTPRHDPVQHLVIHVSADGWCEEYFQHA